MDKIKIDGSYGEGGGQIIRTSLSLSAITQKPFTINHVRSNRKKPGLQPQHLMACMAVKRACKGVLYNAELGSTEFSFEPNKIVSGNYYFDIGTAGSVILVAQTLIPLFINGNKPCLFRIIGGTHVPKSPGFDYFNEVFLKAIAKFGAKINVKLIRVGYYPKGGGIIEVTITPTKLLGVQCWQADTATNAIIRLAGLPRNIAEREHMILAKQKIHNIAIYEDESLSVGNAVTIWQGYNGATALGERGKRAEIVADEAVQKLENEKSEIDPYLADQLLIYAVLAQGATKFTTSRISDHLLTNAYTLSHFINRELAIMDNHIWIK